MRVAARGKIRCFCGVLAPVWGKKNIRYFCGPLRTWPDSAGRIISGGAQMAAPPPRTCAQAPGRERQSAGCKTAPLRISFHSMNAALAGCVPGCRALAFFGGARRPHGLRDGRTLVFARAGMAAGVMISFGMGRAESRSVHGAGAKKRASLFAERQSFWPPARAMRPPVRQSDGAAPPAPAISPEEWPAVPYCRIPDVRVAITCGSRTPSCRTKIS